MDNQDYSRLKKLDHTYVWHPFTQMKGWMEEDPLVIDRGEGDYLFDVEGNRYIDGISSLWVTVHGHGRPEITQAIKDQTDKLCHSTLLGQAGVPSTELAARLAEIAPGGLVRTFYSDAGSTATEIGLKIAFQNRQQTGKTQKTKFAGLNLAYHGDTIGAVSVGGMDLFHAVYKPLLFDVVRLPAPYCYRCELGKSPESCGLACAAAAEEIISRESDTLAGLIIEPLVQGAAGIIAHPEGYLRRVADVCKKNDVLLIADEVAVGFGRTGKMFACEWEGVDPDILCLGKGLSGGYLPLAATMATEEVFNGFLGEFDEFKTFFHGHTFTGNPVACAAALANLDVFETDRTVEKLASKIELFSEKLKNLAEMKHVGQVRQRGLMVGVEIVEDPETKKTYEPGLRVPHRIIMEARKNGLIIRPLGDTLVLMPILSMSDDNLAAVVDITSQAIQTITEG